MPKLGILHSLRCAASFGVDPVLEPGTLALLACGLAGRPPYGWRKRIRFLIHEF
jgi:hypothetical protein